MRVPVLSAILATRGPSCGARALPADTGSGARADAKIATAAALWPDGPASPDGQCSPSSAPHVDSPNVAHRATLVQSLVVKHLSRLVDAGLVNRRRAGRWNPHSVVDPQGLQDLLDATDRLAGPPRSR